MRVCTWEIFQKGGYEYIHDLWYTLPRIHGQWNLTLVTVPNERRGTVHGEFRRAVRSSETSQACIANSMIQSLLRNAVYPNLAIVDVIANMCDSEGSTGPGQTATASVSTEQAAIEFIGKQILSWRDARDEYTRVSNRGTFQATGRCGVVYTRPADIPLAWSEPRGS
jgi:hypothetical protein